MSGKGVELAAGYISLTVKKAGNGLKDIEAEVEGVGKTADKVGKQAGQALNDGITKGAKGAGKSVGDAIVESATKAGKDAGKAAGDALKDGIEKSAKGTKVTLPKVDTQPARDSIIRDIGGGILEAARQGAKDAGTTLEAEFGKAAAKAGKAIGDAIGNSPIGDWTRSLGIDGDKAADAISGIGTAIMGIRDKDLAGTLNGISQALTGIGQGDAANVFATIGNAAGTAQKQFSTLSDGISAGGKALGVFSSNAGGIAGKIGGIGAAAAAAAPEVAALTAAILAAEQEGDKLNKKHFHNRQVFPSEGIPGSAQWIWNKGKRLVDGENPVDVFTTGPGGPDAGGDEPAPAPGPGSPVQGPYTVAPAMPAGPAVDYKAVYGSGAPTPQTVLPPLPGRAKGGVTPAGQIFGPGTGISDSIIGIGADGVPTARVSAGEGVVTKAAMDRGGAGIVAALNAGMKLPGFDDGTGPGGVPIPDPMQQRWAAAVQRGFDPSAPLGGGGGEGGLQTGSIRTERLIKQLFPEITNVGGYRPPDGYNEHSSGQALDFMIPGWNTPQGKALGDQLSNFLMQNAGALGLDYTIWQHGQHNPDGSFQMYADRGSSTQNHMDHVHAHSIASGYPGKDQQYFVPPQLQALLGGGKGGAAPNLGAAITGDPGSDPAGLSAAGAPGGKDQRTQGYIPAGAGSSGQAGSSMFSGAMQMGAQAINGLIEQAASAASSAASMGANAFAPGSGGAAGAAASTAIGIGTKAAERAVSYGFQMAGIGGDALAEILLPFGVPRLFQTSPQQFMPQLPGKPAATTTGEKAQQKQDNPAAANQPGMDPGGPVQPGQMPGQQPVGPSVPLATPGTGDYKPAPTPVGAALSGQPGQPGALAPQAQGPAAPAPQPTAPPAPNPAPPVQQPQPTIFPTDLGGLLGLARGGVVGKFDSGGWLMPGGLAANMTNKPEPILNDQQWGDIKTIASQGMPEPDLKAISGGKNDYSMNFGEGSIVVKDVEELSRQLSSKQRLAMMQHAGRP